MLLTQALLSGLATSAFLSAVVIISVVHNVRLWLHDAPQAIQEASAPLTPREKRERWWVAIPLLGGFFVLPALGVLQYEAAHGPLTFGEAYVFLFIAWMMFNLVDLVIIDWLIVVWWHPPFMILPGAEHLMHFNSYRFHFMGFLKGCVLVVAVSAVGAGVLALL